MKTYLSDMEVRELDIDFEAKRRVKIQEARNNVDRVIEKMRKYLLQDGNDEQSLFNKMDKNTKAHFERYMERTGATISEAVEDIVLNDNRRFAYHVLGKDAEKTSYQEQLQFETLSKSIFFDSKKWRNLPNGGKNARFLKDGLPVSERNGASKKSIDFSGTVPLPVCGSDKGPEVVICIAAKYTNGTGGGQDNQADDLESFANCAAAKGYGNPITVLLTDGGYYAQTSRQKYKGATFAEYIHGQYPDKNIVITDSAHFDIALAGFMSKLLEEKTNASR